MDSGSALLLWMTHYYFCALDHGPKGFFPAIQLQATNLILESQPGRLWWSTVQPTGPALHPQWEGHGGFRPWSEDRPPCLSWRVTSFLPCLGYTSSCGCPEPVLSLHSIIHILRVQWWFGGVNSSEKELLFQVHLCFSSGTMTGAS